MATPPTPAGNAAPGAPSSPSAAFPIDALPTDLIIAIFRFAPVAARLNALGLVCKRWRTLALRAVRRLALASARHADVTKMEATVGAALRLFPSLTSLSIACTDAHSLRLPATLTHLRLDLVFWPADGLLSAHFPHLTSLSLCIRSFDNKVDEVVGAFIVRHRATLQKLDLLASFFSELPIIIGRVAQAGLPCVRKLKLHSTARVAIAHQVALVQCAPQLKSLSLDVTDDLLTHPLFPCLVRISSCSFAFSAAVVARLQALPRLRNIENPVHNLPHALAHLVALVRLTGKQPWDALRPHPNVHTVDVVAEWDGLVTPVPLPRLRTVRIERPPTAPPLALLALASAVLGTYPGLDCLRVVMHAGQGSVMRDLCACGLRSGLRSLHVVAPRGEVMIPAAATCGWLRLRRDSGEEYEQLCKNKRMSEELNF